MIERKGGNKIPVATNSVLPKSIIKALTPKVPKVMVLGNGACGG